MDNEYFWRYVFPALASAAVALLVVALTQFAAHLFRVQDRRKKAEATALYCATALQAYSAACDNIKRTLLPDAVEGSTAAATMFDPIPEFPPLSTFRDFHEMTTAAQTEVLRAEMVVFFSKSELLTGISHSREKRIERLNVVADRALKAATYLFEAYKLPPPVIMGRASVVLKPVFRGEATVKDSQNGGA